MIQSNPASRLLTNLTTLRLYLSEIVYPMLLTIPPGTVEDDESWMLSPIDRALLIHAEFVVFCGEQQADWYDDYVNELIYFFGECGETETIVQLTLREAPVMRHLRRFCRTDKSCR